MTTAQTVVTIPDSKIGRGKFRNKILLRLTFLGQRCPHDLFHLTVVEVNTRAKFRSGLQFNSAAT
jgi:hypothetical protein